MPILGVISFLKLNKQNKTKNNHHHQYQQHLNGEKNKKQKNKKRLKPWNVLRLSGFHQLQIIHAVFCFTFVLLLIVKELQTKKRENAEDEK